MSDGEDLEAEEYTESLVYIGFNRVTAEAIVKQGFTSPMMLLTVTEEMLVGDDKTGRKVESAERSYLSLRERQPPQGLPTLGGVSGAMWTGRKLRRLLAGDCGGSGGTDARGEEVGRRDGCHDAEEARSPQEPHLMGEVVGVMGQLHLPLQSGGEMPIVLHPSIAYGGDERDPRG